MYWIVIMLACASPFVATCEVSTTQHLFRTEEDCLAYVTADRIVEAKAGRDARGFCTDVDPPADADVDDATTLPGGTEL